jgi:hypothetical protein
MRARALVLLLAAGCGSGGSGANSAGIPREEIVARTHEAYCQQQARCGLMPDFQQCMDATFSPLGARLEQDLANGKVGYDPAAGKVLVDALAARACGTARAAREQGDEVSLLAAAFPGAVAEGERCCWPSQCAGSAACVVNGTGVTTGTCWQSNGPQPVGHACAQPAPLNSIAGSNYAECVSGAYCDNPSMPAGGTCRALATEGMSCVAGSYPGNCAAGLICQVATLGALEGTCRVPPKRGEPCNPNDPNPCDDPATYCDATAKTCVPAAALGAPCDLASVPCVGYAQCDGARHVCVALGGAGAPCTPGSFCLGDLMCGSSLTCALPQRLPFDCL